MRLVQVASALAALGVVAGCAVGSAEPPADDAATLRDAVAEATSAVSTTSLAVRLLDEVRVTAPVADTAAADSVQVLADAQFAASTLVPGTAAAAAWRDDVLAALGEAATAVARARDWTNGIGDPAEVSAALDASTDRLEALDATLETAAGS